MNHLWIAYDALLVAMGLANLALLFLARKRRDFLTPFILFYAAFTLGMSVALSRRYVTFNIEGTDGIFAFLSYGLSACLSFAVIGSSLSVFDAMTGSVRTKLTRTLQWALAGAALLGVLPLSVQFAPDGQSYQFKPGHYVAVALYLGSFCFVLWLGGKAARTVSDLRDRWFARGLLLLAVVGFVESVAGTIADLRLGGGSLGAEGENFLYSSIPYAVMSVALAVYLLPLIATPPAARAADAATLAALDLSPRETEVLQLLFRGMSNKRIANELQLSEATVKTHLNKIFRKAEVRTRLELVRSLMG